jgi:uncharacterized phage-associated protein
MLRFNPNPQKIIEALTWVASKCPGKGSHFVLKTLFFADKFHLSKYGRPVLGDTYVKLPWGPVPSMAYDLLKGSDYAPIFALEEVSKAIQVVKDKWPRISAKREPNMHFFSRTDIEALEQALDHCRGLSFDDLSNITHQERAWSEATMNGEMDYELMIDDDVENREEFIAHIRETAHRLAL